jgi:hypothetical protein
MNFFERMVESALFFLECAWVALRLTRQRHERRSRGLRAASQARRRCDELLAANRVISL